MKKLSILIFLIAFIIIVASCGGNAPDQSEKKLKPYQQKLATENPVYDPHRGEGKFKEIKVDEKLDSKMAEAGSNTYSVKCGACHKLTDEKLVGPGWAGVTNRREPAWIMNFITNTDEMIDKDPAVQAQLEICLVRMPNQSLSDEEARSLLEFMRKNDGVN